MEYYEDIFSPEDVCAPTVKPKKNADTLTEMKKANRNNYSTVRFKNAGFSYYRTHLQCGSKIIHAISGDVLPGVVGSLDENHYFKVKMTLLGPEDNGTLFYLTRNEYENHQHFF